MVTGLNREKLLEQLDRESGFFSSGIPEGALHTLMRSTETGSILFTQRLDHDWRLTRSLHRSSAFALVDLHALHIPHGYRSLSVSTGLGYRIGNDGVEYRALPCDITIAGRDQITLHPFTVLDPENGYLATIATLGDGTDFDVAQAFWHDIGYSFVSSTVVTQPDHSIIQFLSRHYGSTR